MQTKCCVSLTEYLALFRRQLGSTQHFSVNSGARRAFTHVRQTIVHPNLKWPESLTLQAVALLTMTYLQPHLLIRISSYQCRNVLLKEWKEQSTCL